MSPSFKEDNGSVTALAARVEAGEMVPAGRPRSVDDPHVAFGFQPGEEVLHFLEPLGRMALPLRDLAGDAAAARASGRICVGLPGNFLSVRLGSSSIGPVGSTT
jgi:hypothetical protein